MSANHVFITGIRIIIIIIIVVYDHHDWKPTNSEQVYDKLPCGFLLLQMISTNAASFSAFITKTTPICFDICGISTLVNCLCYTSPFWDSHWLYYDGLFHVDRFLYYVIMLHGESWTFFFAYFGCVADFRRLYIGFSAASTRQKTWRKTETIKIMSEDQKRRVTSFYPMTWLWFESSNFYLIIQNMVFQMQQKSAKQQQRICACLDRINQCFSSNSLDDGRAVEVEGDGCELWEYHPELSHVTTSNGYVFHIFCRRFAEFSVLRFGQRWFDEIHWECEMEKTHRFVHTLDKHETAVAKLKTQKNLKLITIFFQKLFEKNDEQLHRWFIWLHFQVAGDQVYTVDWYRLGHANTL